MLDFKKFTNNKIFTFLFNIILFIIFFIALVACFVLFIILCISIFKFEKAYKLMDAFYYNDKKEFKFSMPFYQFQILFPFICFNIFGKHHHRKIRDWYKFVVLYYCIPLYFLILIIIIIIIMLLYFLIKYTKKLHITYLLNILKMGLYYIICFIIGILSIILFVSIFNIIQAYNVIHSFYYDRVLKACYCDTIGFKFPMSFLNFQINFPFICFKNLGNHRLKDVRRLYWYVILFYNIPIYCIFSFIIIYCLIFVIKYIIKKLKK